MKGLKKISLNLEQPIIAATPVMSLGVIRAYTLYSKSKCKHFIMQNYSSGQNVVKIMKQPLWVKSNSNNGTKL